MPFHIELWYSKQPVGHGITLRQWPSSHQSRRCNVVNMAFRLSQLVRCLSWLLAYRSSRLPMLRRIAWGDGVDKGGPDVQSPKAS
ncbi:hypothetical protein CDEST_05237 [Colletotrichum destructivum]|uniref:Uncharacterized protein n=1 Tax=Colletotrichum destructivum TaxID=34406 RepID=A0AAX4IA41_9PEZI|nr:hypothetical protein CDEST_05237 [Colletotrichum destructivum]